MKVDWYKILVDGKAIQEKTMSLSDAQFVFQTLTSTAMRFEHDISIFDTKGETVVMRHMKEGKEVEEKSAADLMKEALKTLLKNNLTVEAHTSTVTDSYGIESTEIAITIEFDDVVVAEQEIVHCY